MTTIKLDRFDSAIIIGPDGHIGSVIPESSEFKEGTSFIVAVIIFMLQNDHIFNKVRKAFTKKMMKTKSLPIQIDGDFRFHHED